LIAFLGLCLFVTGLFAGPSFAYNGTNEFKYIYRDTQDSVKHYFSDEMALTLRYGRLRAGADYEFSRPEYDRYHPRKDGATEFSGEWEERFLEYRDQNLFVHAGTIDQAIGSGLLFRAWEDEDFDRDTRIEGLLSTVGRGQTKLTAFWGSMEDLDWDSRDDAAGGMDFQFKPFKSTTIGMTGLGFTNAERDGYARQVVGGSRVTIQKTYGDLFVDYGHSKEYKTPDIRTGDALYGAANAYLGNWVVSGAYKQYRNFNYASALNDLPVVNHCGDPISETLEAGSDERGVMGELRWTPETFPETYLSYSEGWTHDWMKRQSDFYGELKKTFDTWTLTGDFAKTELLDKESDTWEKELTPGVSFDFVTLGRPVLVKLEGKYKKTGNSLADAHHYEPLIQTDVAFDKISVSVITQFYFVEFEDFSDQTPWVGAEVTAQVFEHTRIVLFGGREKGGKVCRNGVCRYVPQFEGARLSIRTEF
jgi:hypothetical protein